MNKQIRHFKNYKNQNAIPQKIKNKFKDFKKTSAKYRKPIIFLWIECQPNAATWKKIELKETQWQIKKIEIYRIPIVERQI